MSLNEMMKANTAPVTRLDRSSGKVTLTNACTRLAPRLMAASSSRGSIPTSRAVTQRITYGVAMTMWPASNVIDEVGHASRARYRYTAAPSRMWGTSSGDRKNVIHCLAAAEPEPHEADRRQRTTAPGRGRVLAQHEQREERARPLHEPVA